MDAKLDNARRIYSEEFKKQAVARLAETNNATALALELGIRRNLLYKWQKALADVGPAKAFRGPGRPSRDNEDELTRLRRENARLEMENTILKKFDAYLTNQKL